MRRAPPRRCGSRPPRGPATHLRRSPSRPPTGSGSRAATPREGSPETASPGPRGRRLRRTRRSAPACCPTPPPRPQRRARRPTTRSTPCVSTKKRPAGRLLLFGSAAVRGPSIHDRVSLVDEVLRVDRPTVLQHLVVQVRPGGETRRTDLRDLLPPLLHLPLLDDQLRGVGITGHQAIPVIDLDHQPVIAIPAG